MTLEPVAFEEILTFTRGSTGYFFDASGNYTIAASNAPRFEFDPVTLLPQGLLIEPASANLLDYTNDVQKYSDLVGTVVAIETLATPDGGTVCGSLSLSAGPGTLQSHLVKTAVVVGSYITASCFYKAKDTNYAHITVADATGVKLGYAGFDLVSGTVHFSGGSSIVKGRIKDCGNGWFRCELTATVTSGTYDVRFGLADGLGLAIDSTTNPNSVYIWAMQAEEQPVATSYMPFTVVSREPSAYWLHTPNKLVYGPINGPVLTDPNYYNQVIAVDSVDALPINGADTPASPVTNWCTFSSIYNRSFQTGNIPNNNSHRVVETVATGVTLPVGYTTAFLVSDDNSAPGETANSFLETVSTQINCVGIPDAVAKTITVVVGKAANRYCGIITTNGGIIVDFDAADVTVAKLDRIYPGCVYEITDLGNKFVRVKFTDINAGSSAFMFVGPAAYQSDVAGKSYFDCVPNGTNSVYLCYAAITTSTSLTLLTTSAQKQPVLYEVLGAVTSGEKGARSADALTISDFSWIGPDDFTLLYKFDLLDADEIEPTLAEFTVSAAPSATLDYYTAPRSVALITEAGVVDAYTEHDASATTGNTIFAGASFSPDLVRITANGAPLSEGTGVGSPAEYDGMTLVSLDFTGHLRYIEYTPAVKPTANLIAETEV